MDRLKKKFKKFFHKVWKFKPLVITASVIIVLVSAFTIYYQFDPSLLARLSFYVDMANPSMRIIRVQEGLRKEEIADILAEKLNWNERQEDQFINAHLALNTDDLEGRYFPKTYLMHKDENPLGASSAMVREFNKQIESVKKPMSKEVINEDTILKIASLIQREAAGKHDMRLISGIIWNRVWSGMKLQVDATLQYAKGSEEEGWWNRVLSEDKSIDSPYNTYINKGLPPGPIANPGLEAIKAAYNPQKTDCMFYLHDKNRKIYCAKDYEGHKRNIEKYLR